MFVLLFGITYQPWWGQVPERSVPFILLDRDIHIYCQSLQKELKETKPFGILIQTVNLILCNNKTLQKTPTKHQNPKKSPHKITIWLWKWGIAHFFKGIFQKFKKLIMLMHFPMRYLNSSQSKHKFDFLIEVCEWMLPHYSWITNHSVFGF